MANLLNNAILMAAENSGKWSVTTFLKNTLASVKGWGSGVILIIGAIMIIVAAYKIFVGLKSPEKQVNWIATILLLFVGGAFFGGGFKLLSGIAQGGKDTLQSYGTGTEITNTIDNSDLFTLTR